MTISRFSFTVLAVFCALTTHCVLNAAISTQTTTPSRSILAFDSIPHSVSPRNDSTFNCIPEHIFLRWTPGTSFDNSYFVEVSPDSTFEKLIVSDVVVIDTFDIIAVPKADTTLYWRVRTQFDTTAIWHFNLRLPRPTTIVAPKVDTLTVNPIAFVWNAAPGANKYELGIDATAYSRRDTTSDTTVAVTLLGFKTYTWKVRPLCGDGAGEWSNEGHFYLNTETNDVSEGRDDTHAFRIHHDAMAELLVISPTSDDIRPRRCVLYNALGRMVNMTDMPTVGSHTISVRGLSAGLYVLTIENQDEVYTRTLILEH